MLKVVIVLSVLSAVALGAISFQATNKVGSGVTVTPSATNGVKIDFTTAGWAYSDPISSLYNAAAGSNTAEVIYVTVQASSPTTGVGLMLATTASTACDSSAWTSPTLANPSLVGKQADACSADVLTVYSGALASGTSTSQLPPTATANRVAPGTTMTWTISTNVASTSTSSCYQVNVVPPKTTSTADTFNNGGTCEATATNYANKLKRNFNLALYVEQTAAGTGSVCLQTQAQYLLNPGVCTSTARTAVGVTFTNPIKSTAAPPTATSAANGITVSFTAAGWITSDPLALQAGISASSAIIEKFYSTVTGTTSVGVGVVALPAGGAASGCTTAALVGKGTLLGQGGATDCPSDFLTVYNVVNPSGTSTSALIPSTPGNLVGTRSVAWTLVGNSAAGASNCNQATVIPPKAATDTAFNNGGTCAANSNSESVFKRDKQYGIYVESLAAGTVSVCIQNQDQYTNNAGNCATRASGSGSGSGSGTSSASIVSAIMAPIVLVMLMIFA